MARMALTRRWAPLFAGFLLTALVARHAHALDWTKAQMVSVVMVEYAFKPANLTFHRGVVYRLRIDNQGKETHEFTAPQFFKAIRIRDPRVVNSDLTEIVVQPGEQKDLVFVARQPGSYTLDCSDHDWAGMVGSIVITP